MSSSPADTNRPADRPPAEVILGSLNFSTGRPEPTVQAAWNAFFSELPADSWESVRSALERELDQLSSRSPAFRDIGQAREVLACVFDELLPAYLRHHADLLFHATPDDLLNPFFLSRLCEAVLAAGVDRAERDRVVTEALSQLNDFVGHRPLAVLENNRKAEVYPHERYRPVPLYIRGAGVAVGPYRDIIAAALEHLAATPADLLEQASLDPERLDEIALDVRAHDALHPVFKRTNYLFGEWDPHLIDNQGHFRRFVVRRIILDALLAWMSSASELSEEDRLHDASAVLCGTILMASAISGWGPAAHDSTASLTSLLPVVAHQRDAFYARLMGRISGRRAARLAGIAESTRQPFGHVRQHLNIYLANYAAAQMQRRAVAEQFARMGFFEAAREEAARIPAASLRFECELDLRAEAAVRSARNDGAAAANRLAEATELLVRGIECGAVIDPWNIIGFQGQFPLFVAREDSVPDPRAEWLIDYMNRLFAAGGRVLTEAAAGGDAATATRVYEWLDRTATWWDRYATTTVSDLPDVRGADLAASASAVAGTIAEWRAAGRASGDLSFWRERVVRLESPKAFADVVEALLTRGDFVASSGLLIQWLSQAEDIGLGDGPQSFYDLSLRWLRELTSGPGAPVMEEQARLCRRFFDFLEANAGDFWFVPALGDPIAEQSDEPSASSDEDDDEGDGGEGLFGAAYEGVVYRDSTADGFESSVLDTPSTPSGGEFEAILGQLEPRLRFLDLLAQLWRIAAGRIDGNASEFAASSEAWLPQVKRWQRELSRLAATVAKHPLGIDSGDFNANIEYDAQLQSKIHLLHLVTGAAVRMAAAERLLRSRVTVETPEANSADPSTQVLRPLLARDIVGVRTGLPALLRWLAGQPLLYVAVENGGDPLRAIEARINQELLTTLVAEFPRLGLLRETRQVLRVALRMERRSRPAGLSVSEFDRLFRTAFECVLRTAVASRDETGHLMILSRRRSNFGRARHRPYSPTMDAFRSETTARRSTSGRRRPHARGRNDSTVALVGIVVERYLDLWLQHAATMRLSAVEALNDSTTWSEARRFIRQYGSELFHARSLPLSNLRAILHEGVDTFLDHLLEQRDPLHPSRFAEALEGDGAFRRQATRLLELIYATVVDEIERFIEYNSTTTQSDYGERFDSFLDFLRAEAAYRRDEWDLTPLRIAHEVLAASGEGVAARLWEEVVRTRTAPLAAKHLARLASLEKRHAMRLPSISDHLAERFVKPFAVDRMLALIPLAVYESRGGDEDSLAFRMLRREIDTYIATSTGSAAELPDWIGKINLAVSRAVDGRMPHSEEREAATGRPIPRLRRGQVLRQVARSRPARRRR